MSSNVKHVEFIKVHPNNYEETRKFSSPLTEQQALSFFATMKRENPNYRYRLKYKAS